MDGNESPTIWQDWALVGLRVLLLVFAGLVLFTAQTPGGLPLYATNEIAVALVIGTVSTIIIVLPILFHAIYGIYIARQARYNVAAYPYLRNWNFMLQRITGFILFFYIALHVWETRVQVIFDETLKTRFFEHMQEILSNPIWLAIYVVGVVSASYHFANGLFTFGIVWGITAGRRAQQPAFAFRRPPRQLEKSQARGNHAFDILDGRNHGASMKRLAEPARGAAECLVQHRPHAGLDVGAPERRIDRERHRHLRRQVSESFDANRAPRHRHLAERLAEAQVVLVERYGALAVERGLLEVAADVREERRELERELGVGR